MLNNLVDIHYKGGRCGEFLTGYLSKHQGFKPVEYVWNPATNTYNVHDDLRNYLKHLYTIDVELVAKFLDPELKTVTSTYYSCSRDQVLEAVTFFKKVFLENSAVVVISHSKQHNLFFDCMLMIKHWFKVMPSGVKRWREEFPECSTTDDFLDNTHYHKTGESELSRFLISAGFDILDLDQIFFEKNYSSWLRLLNRVNSQPLDNFALEFEQYHARNLLLASEYGVPLYKNTDDDWFRQWMRIYG